jgi:hypothetical protein
MALSLDFFSRPKTPGNRGLVPKLRRPETSLSRYSSRNRRLFDTSLQLGVSGLHKFTSAVLETGFDGAIRIQTAGICVESGSNLLRAATAKWLYPWIF